MLYVRCTAIDPADPGILIGPDEALPHKSQGMLSYADFFPPENLTIY